jgi:ribosomal protein S18 acetylase RimI-like enzyme
VRQFEPGDQPAVLDLWQRAGLTRPWNDPVKDIQRKMAVQPELFLVGTLGGVVVATAMLGYDGHRGWVYYFAVSNEHRLRGYGTTMMESAESLLRARGCAKINLQVRVGNEEAMAFYRRLGFSLDDVVGMGKRLEHDDV